MTNLDGRYRRLLVATHNKGKLAEYKDLLSNLGATFIDLDAAGIDWDVEETGKSFEENAVLKARAYAEASGLLTLADDSGLEVDALDGKPGVRTARFGGPGLTPVERYELLLQKLAKVPDKQRGARFRCVVALANSSGLLHTASGAIEGRIAHEPSGSEGFGYDPVFYISEQQATMAQLPTVVKNRISHRARALTALRPYLETLLAEAGA